MAQSIPKQLATHIDTVCGLHNTGGVSQFFDEDGGLVPYEPGQSMFAYITACSLLVYEPEEHDDYLTNVWNMLEGDIDGLKRAQDAVDSFKMPELAFQVGMKVFWTDPDEGACSGIYIIEGINGDQYLLGNEVGSEVSALESELKEVD